MRGIVLRPDAPHGVRDAVFPGIAAHQVRAVLELLAGVPHGDAAACPAEHLQIVEAGAEGDALPGVQPQEMGSSPRWWSIDGHSMKASRLRPMLLKTWNISSDLLYR